MRRVALVVVAVMAAAVLTVELVPVFVCIWDGGYELTVHLDASDPPPAGVGLFPLWTRAEAEDLCGRSPGSDSFEPGWGTVAAPVPAGARRGGC